MLHFGKVTHAAQQAVCDTRRTAGTLRHFKRALFAHLQTHIAGATANNMLEIGHLVKLQALHDAETVAQRRS